MKKILIAIDYNPCAQTVAETGFEYAKAMNATASLVHAVADNTYYAMDYSPIMGFGGFSPDCNFKNIKEQENEAGKFLEAVVKHLGDKTIKTKVLNGITADAILQYAKDYHADLIVMGAQSHNGLEKILLGSVVSDVLKNAAIPVLVVPTARQDFEKITQEQEVHHYI